MFKRTHCVVVRVGTLRQRFNGNVQTEILGSKLSLTETESLNLFSRRLPPTGQLFVMVFLPPVLPSIFGALGKDGRLLREVKVICLFDLRCRDSLI